MNASLARGRAFGDRQVVRLREPAVRPRDQQARVGTDQFARTAEQRVDQRLRLERGEQSARDRGERGETLVLHLELLAAQHDVGDVVLDHDEVGRFPARRRGAGRRPGRGTSPSRR